MRNIKFSELLELLDQAEAIKFDGHLVHPQVDVDDNYFEVSLIDDDKLVIYPDDVSNLYINDYGNIEFELGGDDYMITVLQRVELV